MSRRPTQKTSDSATPVRDENGVEKPKGLREGKRLLQALGRAFASQQEEHIRQLIASHVAQTGRPSQGFWQEAAAKAIRSDSAAGLRALRSFSPIQRSGGGYFPLHIAAEERSANAMRELLAQGADPGKHNANGLTPLGLAVLEYKPANKRKKELAAKRADGNGCGAIECIRALAQHGASARKPMRSGLTPLQMAAFELDATPFYELLRQGAAEGLTIRQQTEVVQGCLYVENFQDEKEGEGVNRLKAFAPKTNPATWESSEVLLGVALLEGGFLEWLISQRLCVGLSDGVNKTIGLLLECEPNREHIRRIEQLLPLSAPCAKNGRSALLAGALNKLERFGSSFKDLAPALDLVCAYEPRQPGAERVWALANGSQELLPRLHARVEAEWLRQELGMAQAGERPAQAAKNQAQKRAREGADCNVSRLQKRL
jgi:hypothetical protein